MINKKKLADFLDEIEAVCRKHQITIAHEDSNGGFLFDDFRQRNLSWLREGLVSGSVPKQL